jgi:hypothetical protein
MSRGSMDENGEVVGLFADRESFDRAFEMLVRRGFDRTDLSVLASHDSLDAAGQPGRTWRDAMLAIAGELKYEGPLVASGAIFLAGGPIAASIAAVIGAAVGGVAVKDVLEEVTAKPHTQEFARSLAAGSVILWVRATDTARQSEARAILEANGGANVHVAPPTARQPTATT